MIILGLDPGLCRTGFGIITVRSGKVYYLSSGVIVTSAKDSEPNRLGELFSTVSSIIKEFSPTIASIEKVFLNTNPRSTLSLGQARGAIICACSSHSIPVYEYTALQIKKTVVGYGHASKPQVASMVVDALHLNQKPQQDATDALAAAITSFYYNLRY